MAYEPAPRSTQFLVTCVLFTRRPLHLRYKIIINSYRCNVIPPIVYHNIDCARFKTNTNLIEKYKYSYYALFKQFVLFFTDTIFE